MMLFKHFMDATATLNQCCQPNTQWVLGWQELLHSLQLCLLGITPGSLCSVTHWNTVVKICDAWHFL